MNLAGEKQEQKMAALLSLEITSSKVDGVRERELYRYFQPPETPTHQDTISVHAASSPNTALTALAQLCAIRLHAKRAMIRWGFLNCHGDWS